MAFHLPTLLKDVFDPQAGEQVIVACDLPTEKCADRPVWQDRRAMAHEWHAAFAVLGAHRGFDTKPILTFAATGGSNRELPVRGMLNGRQIELEQELNKSTLAVFLTEYSATAPLTQISLRNPDFRAASLPGLERRMERTGLAADYREVSRRCQIIAKLLTGATALDVTFSTGHRCIFDLRFRTVEAEDGYLPRYKKGDRIINLPSGETFIVPYEGERLGELSRTEGVIPASLEGVVAELHVVNNRIVEVRGEGPGVARLRDRLALDPARANLAEVAFGCNDWAEVSGNVLEDEKAGFHFAYGRSEHLGGTTGPSAFLSPENILHEDIVYARGNPIQVAEAVIVHDVSRKTVMVDGIYTVF